MEEQVFSKKLNPQILSKCMTKWSLNKKTWKVQEILIKFLKLENRCSALFIQRKYSPALMIVRILISKISSHPFSKKKKIKNLIKKVQSAIPKKVTKSPNFLKKAVHSIKVENLRIIKNSKNQINYSWIKKLLNKVAQNSNHVEKENHLLSN